MFISYIVHPDRAAYLVINLGCAIPDLAGSTTVPNNRNLSRKSVGK